MESSSTVNPSRNSGYAIWYCLWVGLLLESSSGQVWHLVSRFADLISGSMETGLDPEFTGVGLVLESMGMSLGPGFV